MAQHDFVIDNGPGLAVRTDMNAAVMALLTMSSGPLEPVTKYPGMFWLDTSVPPNGSLKMRDQANAAWIFPSFFGDDRVGEVTTFARSTPPAGWLKADGAAVSRTAYAALYAAIGTQFGVGDGTSTFNLPDCRGQFIRGWDDGRGLDPSRAFGSSQADAIESHAHTATTVINAAGAHDHALSGTAAAAGTHTHTITVNAAGAHTHTVNGGNSDVQGQAAFRNGNNAGPMSTTSSAGNHAHSASCAPVGNHTHTVTGTTDTEAAHTHTATTTVAVSGGGLETRPTNIALLACIRYA